ncbi:hypothetical protein HRI_001074000 [Hibiscus trionum]|uniref:histone acetyltransferase n=1 Tax=Hibiscus trionum TaxID=183268 RepID=A0A9W7HAR5_HIBTR|nr:hypothetical protein HRI_001074000 [Hibiscus trionum]
MTPSSNIPNLQFHRPFEAEARCPLTGQNQSLRPVNEQAVATHNHLPQLPFTRQNQSLRLVNEQAATHGHLSFTGQNQSFCPINEQAAIHGHLPFEESHASSERLSILDTQKKVLLAYIWHKNSGMFAQNDALFSFVNHMHSTVCCQYICKCFEFYSIASHYDGCHDARCDICSPFRYIPIVNIFRPVLEHVKRGLPRVSGKGDSGQSICSSSEAMQPLPKRLKLENPTFTCLPYNGMIYSMAPFMVQPSFTELPSLSQSQECLESSNSEIMEANTEFLPKLLQDSTISKGMGMTQSQVQPSFTNLPSLVHFSEFPVSSNFEAMEVNTELLQKLIEDPTVAKGKGKNMEVNTELLPNLIEDSSNDAIGSYKEEDIDLVNGTKQRGVSLIENFSAQQIKEHISSLRKYIDQDLGKKERENGVVNVDSKDSCQLCGAVKLSLSPAPIYCSSCCARIRCGAMYYSIPEANGIKHCLCSVCCNASRSKGITSSGISVSKAKLIKMKNDDEPEEWWVQCDKCKCWQHQICALFNEKMNKRGKYFVCPKCCLKEIENGERMPPLVGTVFGAKDLPRTMLSDHLEQRLSTCLQKNREEKARATGMSIDEVPEVEGLVVREVLSVQKLVKVNKQLLDILQDQNYPAEFPYKSKVILLFQNIEGADVCLFIMYVQEFGAECGRPNQRCVYISYLDSVKYFRPETETAASREVLRTVVYHDILVGYLEYCKKRGFATCYIWACPPRKGEDYILYCHPEVQKIPKPDKLRQWHKNMLQKATKAGIVVDLTNLYDQFFSTGKYNTKVTAAHLPYFDGDYWSSAAEDMIKHIEKASGEDSKNTSMKTVSKRTLQSMGHTNPSAHALKDILLMQKLGQNILSMKEDFIIAHLQFVCVCCHRAILDGCRWSCDLCKSFQLCGRCHDAKQSTYKDSTHTLWNGEKHSLCRILVDDVPSDTEDKDVCIDNDLFENRYKFLMFCQKNNYQFDTLRRAKHSSMMILYYLHNPEALLARTNCCICNKDAPIDQCWHCETCSDYFVCATCYQRDGCSLHIHKLTSHSSAVDSSTAKENNLSKVLELLLHAARCRSLCSDFHCHLMKKLFSHSRKCTVRTAGGCRHCKKTWLILKLHSRNCQESDCAVPRCRDLKQHAKSLAQRDAAL